MNLRPTSQEEVFLSLAYNRFYDLADEIIEDSFWEQEDWYRFSRVINLFSGYASLHIYAR